MKLSVIIPVYNEEKVIGSALESLSRQTIKDFEIIVVDDGSTDNTIREIKNCKLKIENLFLLRQKHAGPGAARNLAASKAKGSILVFVDADMEFVQDFLEKLIAPIDQGVIGTFSKDEYLLNKKIAIARCWNLNMGRPADRMIGENEYQNGCPVYRAILKTKFVEVSGFNTTIGYTDDWSLSRKLNRLAVVAPGAIYYHRNPETLKEIWTQARWFGKNEFLTGSLVRKFYNLFRYFPLFAFFKGTIGAIQFKEPKYFSFKITYDSAIFLSVIKSFFAEEKFK